MCQAITKWRDSLMNIKSIYKIKSKYEINHLKSYAMAISSAYVYTYNQYLDKHHDIAIQRNLTCQLPFNIQSLPISNKQWRLTLMTYMNITASFLLEKTWTFTTLLSDQVTSHYLNQCWSDYRCIYASHSLNELNKTHAASNLLFPGWWLHARLWCLQCISTGDTTVLHWAIAMYSRFHVTRFKHHDTYLQQHVVTGVTLGLRPANEKRRYKVTPSLIGWAQS